MAKYEWQGEPVKIKLGHCKINENKEKPIYWYNFECNMRLNLNEEYEYWHCEFDTKFGIVDAVQVIHSTGSFILANHFGIGIHKLINGGWPSHQHFSLDGKFEELNWKETIHLLKFDEVGFAKHEAARNKWQKENYPVEFEKLEKLRLGAMKYRNLSNAKR